jgi:hypothetical protein
MVVTPADRPLTARRYPRMGFWANWTFIHRPKQRFSQRLFELARAAFEVAIAEKPAGRFMIRHRIRVVKRHPEGDW